MTDRLSLAQLKERKSESANERAQAQKQEEDDRTMQLDEYARREAQGMQLVQVDAKKIHNERFSLA